jgi:cytidylate kinase
LTAALALSGGHYRLSGVPRMHERPIGDLVDGLRQIGCDVRYAGKEGYPPLEIFPAAVKLSAPIRVRGDVSSQFLTALLMALPLTGETAVIEMTTELISKPYIEITLNLMARFGVKVEREGWSRFTIPAGQKYRSPGLLHVEGDASSASYFLAAGMIGGGPVRVEGVGRNSIQGDVKFADALETMGAQITWGDNWIDARAPADGKPKAFDLDLNHIPDAAMTLAVAALFADGKCTLRNIASWRVKETDRIAAPVVAIDGPSASGKGTVAQRVAAALGYHFLDSGALYRLTALAAMKANVSLDDEAAVAAIAAELPAEFVGDNIYLGKEEVGEAIRAEVVGNGASKVAAWPAVRAALLERQRAYRRFPGLVADGRDMGSVVFPEAPVKVFLTASAEARGERRHKQLIDKGMPDNMRPLLQDIVKDLRERDARDAARSVAPLKQCADADLVDTTALNIDEAVAAVMGSIHRRLPFIN